MLKLTVELPELFNEEDNSFIRRDCVILEMEHSLASLSKWESITERPFLSNDKKSVEDTKLYIKTMVTNGEFDDEIFDSLSSSQLQEVNTYIGKKMTATWFTSDNRRNQAPSREVITAEIIYYWMTALNIPFECENWHLERLMTLIRVCNEKSQPAKKSGMSRKELAAQRSALNARRRQQLGTTG